jgi:hypothetical protein
MTSLASEVEQLKDVESDFTEEEVLVLYPGDKVFLHSLKSMSDLNEKTGKVLKYHVDRNRYEISITGRKKTLAVKPSNLSFEGTLPRGEDGSVDEINSLPVAARVPIHVLVPCNVISQREALRFIQTFKSFLYQTASCFIFIGLSGTDEWTKNIVELVHSLGSSNKRLSLFLVKAEASTAAAATTTTTTSTVPRFTCLQALLLHSMRVNPEAYLLFAESEDMFHNTRVEMFQGFIASKPGRMAYCLPEKLVIDEEESNGEVVSINTLLRSDGTLPKNIKIAQLKTYQAMDANEYFDWCVSSEYMHTFFEITPAEVAANRHCDIRFNAQLERLARTKDFPVAGIDQWLYAHHKTSMHSKKKTFDASTSISSGAVGAFTAADEELAKIYTTLSPAQVAICRLHLNSLIVGYDIWSQDNAAAFFNGKKQELNELYGAGFGDTLFAEEQTAFRAAFDAEKLAMNEGLLQYFVEK